MECGKKKRYPTQKMADNFAEIHNRDPFIKEKDFLVAYHCNIHEGWHVGRETRKTEDLPPHIRVQRILDGLENE